MYNISKIPELIKRKCISEKNFLNFEIFKKNLFFKTFFKLLDFSKKLVLVYFCQ